ncbi:MAG: GNAT family N-acetyltransferase [bacterium]|nr:GNAT family N-acetyltransferase [bacterium]
MFHASSLPGPIHRKMSLREYRDFPRRLGWKYEYWNGSIHVTPNQVAVPLTLELSSHQRKAGSVAGVRLRGVEEYAAAGLRELFVSAFSEAVHFAGCSPEEIEQSAKQHLRHFFAEHHGRRLPASRLAEAEEKVVGAVLVREFRRGPLLDMLYVAPERQRSGIAGALLEAVVEELLHRGETMLHSSVMLSNEASLDWHLRHGFQEEPNLRVLAMRSRFFAEEVKRHRRLRDASPAELAQLEETATQWQELYLCFEELAVKRPDLACPVFC